MLKIREYLVRNLPNGFVSRSATVEVRLTALKDGSAENVKLKTQRRKKKLK